MSGWRDGLPIGQAIDQVQPFFGPYSTAHHRRLEQLVFLTRVPPGAEVTISFQNPDEDTPEEVTMEADVEYDSLFQALPYFAEDELILPVQGKVLPSVLGYIKISTFSADYNTMASLWDFYISTLIDNEIPGLIEETFLPHYN